MHKLWSALCLGIECLISLSLCLIFSQTDTDMLICVSNQALSGRYYANPTVKSEPVKTTIVSLVIAVVLHRNFYNASVYELKIVLLAGCIGLLMI